MFSDNLTHLAIAIVVLFGIDYLFWDGALLIFFFNTIIKFSTGMAMFLLGKLGFL